MMHFHLLFIPLFFTLNAFICHYYMSLTLSFFFCPVVPALTSLSASYFLWVTVYYAGCHLSVLISPPPPKLVANEVSSC